MHYAKRPPSLYRAGFIAALSALFLLTFTWFINKSDVGHAAASQEQETLAAAPGVWQPLGPFRALVNAVALQPGNPNIVYAGTAGGVFKSSNGGNSWSRVSDGLPALPVSALALHPSDPNTLYAAINDSNGGVFKSTNGGASWSAVNTGLASRQVKLLALSAANPNILYAGTASSGVFASGDGGASWATVYPTGAVEALAVSQANASLVFAGIRETNAPQGLFRSSNGGTNWTNVLPGAPATALALSPSNASTVYAYTDAFRRSTDGGATWSFVSAPPAPFISLAVAAGVIYGGGAAPAGGVYSGVFKSTNDGASWTAIGQDFLSDGLAYTALAVAPNNANVLYAGSQGRGLYRTTDGGVGWTAPSDGLLHISDLAANTLLTSYGYSATQPTALYAGAFVETRLVESFLKSDDNGRIWFGTSNNLLPPLSLQPFRTDRVLGVHPTNPNIAFVERSFRADENPHFRTIDGGATWGDSFLGTGSISLLAFNNNNPDIIWVSENKTRPSNGGVRRSLDGGQTWGYVPGPTGTERDRTSLLGLSPADGNVVYIRTSGLGIPPSIFKSTDGGATWALVGPVPAEISLVTFRVSKTNPNVVYAAGASTASPAIHLIFRSNDGGATWSNISAGLPEAQFGNFEISPLNAEVVYLTVNGARGVYKTSNGGAAWAPFDSGLPAGFAFNLSIDATGLLLRVLASNRIIYELMDTVTTPCQQPVVAVTPVNNNVCAGENATFTANVSAGTPPFTYQWRKGDAVIPGATAATLTIAATAENNGDYSVAVTNACGTVVSAAATLRVGALTITPVSAALPAAGGEGSFTVGASTSGGVCRWTAQSDVPWLTITSTTATAVTYNTATNGGAARTGTLTVTGANGVTRTHTVIQSAGSPLCTFALAPLSITVPATGGSGDINVTTASGCNWTAVSNAPWLNITAGATGVGNGAVSFTAAANPGMMRTGTLTIAGLTFTVTQNGESNAVAWVNQLNVGLFGAILRKTGGANDGRWDGHATSQQTLTAGDGYVEFTVSGPRVYRACGLNTDTAITDDDSIDYAVVLTNVGYAEYREAGRYLNDTPYAVGDVFRVAVIGNTVNFYRNGRLVATSTKAPVYPLRAAAAFSLLNGEISNAKLIVGRPPAARRQTTLALSAARRGK